MRAENAVSCDEMEKKDSGKTENLTTKHLRSHTLELKYMQQESQEYEKTQKVAGDNTTENFED